jgi:hypothetical protein
MSTSTFSGPVRAGTIGSGSGTNTGTMLLVQTGSCARNATLVSDLTFNLPANSTIVDVWAEPTVLFDSATSATLSFGTASGGTQYGGSLDVKTAGVKRATSTIAIAAAKANIGTNTTLVATVTSVGQPTVGAVQVYVQYIQN